MLKTAKAPITKGNKKATAAAGDVAGMEDIQARLKQIERKDWWLWVISVLMMPLMAMAVLSLSLPNPESGRSEFFQFQLEQGAKGLLGLVLLFCIYTIYQQILLRRFRRQESEHLFERSRLEIKAEVARQLAMLDPLTGVCNRRFLDQYLETEMPRSERHGYPLTLLMLDLNDFKAINDQHGHPVGDLVLKEFANRVRAGLRSSDVVVRMGGDEFLAVLPDCGSEQVPALLTRMKDLEVDHCGERIPFTFSAGYVTYRPGELPWELLDRADQAVYVDKRATKSNE
jgi:diguanylate cyclase (GGDEF)-like protein